MKVLFDVNHPAHVHFFKWPIKLLKEQGVDVVITSRKKDVALKLLAEMGVDSLVLSSQGSGVLGLLKELLIRNFRLYKVVKQERPDVMLSVGGTFIAHVGLLTRVPSLVFYDTENAILQNGITYPFATEVHVPECYEGSVPKKKERRYKGYHELSYLHPDYFTPDKAIAEASGVDLSRNNYLIRLVSWQASHDIGEQGWSEEVLSRVIERLSKQGKVLISTEADLPERFAQWIYDGKASDLHHVIAFCSMVVGESPTLASEAAVLGVPAIYVHDQGLGYTNEQEKKYGLVKNVFSLEWDLLSVSIDQILSADSNLYLEQRKLLLDETIDVVGYVVNSANRYLAEC
ncbi:DUF354 domain-containing protein [Oceanicoccus sagamiensis]|uniref:DUF354 domain-containing protein n=1 Tax=Oceanicoccus sagamiensis TaxID=716816 RepID=A0A1X9NDK2_9GAMM|nr:DUF354 domain-containing protein [Oceanicoccus sagamiensis]ARN73027.1 hypothetical protein BST96_02235 [Oceanicoccus sagamiensis]